LNRQGDQTVRIVDIRDVSLPISRYADPAMPSGGLTTSLVAVITDVLRDGKPIVGYGFASIGRFAQGGLIRERFAPRLLAATDTEIMDAAGTNLDPFRAWKVMMANEKPGGHGERCVAVGTIDMALWDAAAKIARLPLYRFLGDRIGRPQGGRSRVSVYAGGGYYYPADDMARLSDEVRRVRDLGHRRAKIKIGSARLAEDLKRIEAAARLLDGPEDIAVDAMNSYTSTTALGAADALSPLGLWWFEDICDPLDFETVTAVARRYAPPIAAGEALFSRAEANLLDRHAGMRRNRDILVFDPVHCYGVPGYLQIVELLEKRGWPRGAFWPHGGHLFGLHVAAALGLGGAEVNPLCFQPFGGYADDTIIGDGVASPPELPGIGFEGRQELWKLFRCLVEP
jgi:L-alanine-DL-glutamate epimerase-like enolase superfamily enzyme